ncbi:MAG TPA: hypothetical protein VMJ10_31895 [Kofleriaceae bacterium]|nr:hypothetical protein [Kofleriaceae bacterium]
MGVIERVLRKWGYIRLGRYGLELTPDDRVVPLRPEQPIPQAVAPAPVPPVAPPPAVEEDEWEWEIAMARARASSTEGVRPGQRPLPGMPPMRHAQQMPVARPTPTLMSAAMPPRRFPRASLPPQPQPAEPWEALGDATIRTLAVPPANDDDTSPGLLAPPPVRRAGSKRC